jgi:hypothetical protein
MKKQHTLLTRIGTLLSMSKIFAPGAMSWYRATYFAITFFEAPSQVQMMISWPGTAGDGV